MIRCPFCARPSQAELGVTVRCLCGHDYIAQESKTKTVILTCPKCKRRRTMKEGVDPALVPCACSLRPQVTNNECVHRGPQQRLETCASCNGRVQIKIFSCHLHGQCSIEPHDPKVRPCSQCPDRKDYDSIRSKVRFVTTADLMKDSLKLISKLPHQISAIAGIPRSGMMPASLIATSLHLPLYTLTHKGFDLVGCGWRLSDVVHNHREGPVVVIDDTSMYGGALSMAKEFWKKFGGGREAVFSTVYCSPVKYHQHGPMPDVWAQELYDPHLLEWCFFNCGFAKRTAFDFDGVLTVDGTDKPLYKPMKYPVELIVTGRLEKQREYSENWLRRHGIRWKKMVMWRGSLEERDESVEKIAEFKAEEFDKSGLRFFVESDPVQSAHIAKLTKKLVICPTIAKVF